jgi:uncharacterized protein
MPDAPTPGFATSPDDAVHSQQFYEGKRIESPDVLRGIAILGALLVSIWMFGGLTGNIQKNLLMHPSGGNYRLFATVQLLFQGKMLALIALVFGASMVAFFSRGKHKGKLAPADIFTRRQLLLIILGVINGFIFFNTNDLLFQLGAVGLLLFAFVRMNAKGLFIASFVTILIFCGKIFWDYSDTKTTYKKFLAVSGVEKKFKIDSVAKSKARKQAGIAKDRTIKKDTLTKQQKEDKEAWVNLEKQWKYNPDADKEQIKSVRSGSYAELYKSNESQNKVREARWTYQTGVWQVSCMMFLGMALFKIGFFTNRFKSRRYLLLGIAFVAIGLLLGWYRLYFNNAALINYPKFLSTKFFPFQQWQPFEFAFTALGYACLVIWMLQKNILSSLWKTIACVGQMALTNYLLQSIFFLFFFTGFGMTNYAKLVQYELYFLVAEVWLVQTVFSMVWLKYFYYGPAEWLIRRLSYGEGLPFYRSQPTVLSQPSIS